MMIMLMMIMLMMMMIDDDDEQQKRDFVALKIFLCDSHEIKKHRMILKERQEVNVL